jgi:flagellar protein FlaG
MEIRPLSTPTPGPQGLDALGATAASAASQEQPEPTSPALEPAVKLDIGSPESKARFIQDPDTSAIVFQVVDSSSGDVLDQLPSETALRNRAYDAARETRGAQAGSLSRVA